MKGNRKSNFTGFKTVAVITTKDVNIRKGSVRSVSTYVCLGQNIIGRKISLINLGNTCFMNSLMLCLNSATHLVKHIIEGTYCKDI